MKEKDKSTKDSEFLDKESLIQVERLLGKPKNIFLRYKEIGLLALITPAIQILSKDDLIGFFVFLGYIMINKGFQNLLNTKFNFDRINNLINLKIGLLFLLFISESIFLKNILEDNHEILSYFNIGFKLIFYIITIAISVNLNSDFKTLNILMNKYRKSLVMLGIFGVVLQILDIADKAIIKSYHGNISQFHFWETIIFIILIFFILVNAYNSVYLARIFFKEAKEN